MGQHGVDLAGLRGEVGIRPRGVAVVLRDVAEQALELADVAVDRAPEIGIRGVAAAELKGRKGQSTTLYAPGGGLSRLVLVGLGKRDALNPAAAEAAGGHAVAALGKETVASVDATPLLDPTNERIR